MATVTSLTADRMIAIEEASIVAARKEGSDLILTSFGGTDHNVGNIDGVGIASSEIHYQQSTSGTIIPTGTWSPTIPSVSDGNFLWTRITFNLTNSTTTIGYAVAKYGAQGPKGDKGDKGDPGSGSVNSVNGDFGPDIIIGIDDIADLRDDLDGKAALVHTHSGADMTSGTIPNARLPLASTVTPGAAFVATNAEVLSGLGSHISFVTPEALTNAVEISGTRSSRNYYEKYPDGRLICRGSYDFPANSNTRQNYNWTYPVAFVGEAPQVSVIPQSPAVENFFYGHNNPGLTSAQIYFYRTTSAVTTVLFQAEGRWK